MAAFFVNSDILVAFLLKLSSANTVGIANCIHGDDELDRGLYRLFADDSFRKIYEKSKVFIGSMAFHVKIQFTLYNAPSGTPRDKRITNNS